MFPIRPPSSQSLLKWLALVVVASAIGFATRHVYSREQGGFRPDSVEAKDSVAPKDDSEPNELTISLSAHTHETKSGPIIQLQWDTSAKPIQSSSSGILYIYDGVNPRKLLLQRHELELGSRNYVPETDEVTFHLVLPGGKVKRQSLLVVLGAGKAMHAGSEAEPRVAMPIRALNSPRP